MSVFAGGYNASITQGSSEDKTCLVGEVNFQGRRWGGG